MVVTMVLITQKSIHWIEAQYDSMSYAIIKNSEINEEHLRAVFPPDFFTPNQPNGDSKETG